MTYTIQYVHMPVSESMNTLVDRKLLGLGRKFDFVSKAQVFFKQDKDGKGNGKICEIELSLPGPRVFAKSDSDDFEKSLAETIGDLERQLRKRKNVLKKH